MTNLLEGKGSVFEEFSKCEQKEQKLKTFKMDMLNTEKGNIMIRISNSFQSINEIKLTIDSFFKQNFFFDGNQM